MQMDIAIHTPLNTSSVTEKTSRCPHGAAGFSIVQLIVVIIIISILAVFSVSRWAATITPTAGAEQLASDIRYTQSLAMTHGQRFRITFIGANSYSISTITGTVVPSSVTGANTVVLDNAAFYGVISNLPNSLIAFDGQGIPYTNAGATTPLAATATIQIVVGNSAIRVIQITQTTGRVSIQ